MRAERNGITIGLDPREVAKYDASLQKLTGRIRTIGEQSIKQGMTQITDELETISRDISKRAAKHATEAQRLIKLEGDLTYSAQSRARFKVERERHDLSLKNLEVEYENRSKAQRGFLDRQKGHVQEMAALRAKEAGVLGQGHKAARGIAGVAGLAGAGANLGSVDFGSAIDKFGAGLEKRIAAAVAKSGGEGTVGALGPMLSKIGPMVATIGAIVGGLALVVKVMLDADAQTKEFNRSLLAGIAPIDAMVDSTKSLDENLRAITASGLESYELYSKFRVLGKDQLEILNAYAGAGHLFVDMADGIKTADGRMRSYINAAQTALIYSNALGVSSTEIAQEQGRMMEEYSTGLATIADQYNSIYNAAQLSSFGTKRFYSMVVSATSGMSLYNTQLDSTSGLLKKLSKVMDPERAGEYIKKMQGGFKDEDITTRMKRNILIGTKSSRRINRRDAESQTGSMLGSMGKEGMTGALAKAFEAATGKVMATNSKDLTKQMAGMTSKQQSKLLYELGKSGKKGNKAGQLMLKTIAAAKGTRGKGGGVRQGIGDAALGVGGKFIKTQKSMFGWIHRLDKGNKRDAMKILALEKQGLSGEDFEERSRIGKLVEGEWMALQAAQGASKKGNLSEEENADLLKRTGASIGKGGKIVGADGKVIKSMEAFFQTVGDRFTKGKKASPAEKTADFASKIAKATKDTNVLAKASEMFLRRIANTMEDVYHMLASSRFFKSSGLGWEDRRQVKKYAGGAAGQGVITAREATKTAYTKMMAVQAAYVAEKDPKKKSAMVSDVVASSDNWNVEKFRRDAREKAMDLTNAAKRDPRLVKKGEGGFNGYMQRGMLKAGFISETGEGGQKQLKTIMNGNLGAIKDLHTKANTAQAAANAKAIIKAEGQKHAAQLESLGLDKEDKNYYKYAGELESNNWSPELRELLFNKATHQYKKPMMGMYAPSSGNTVYSLHPQDNVLAWKPGEEGAAAAKLGIQGGGGTSVGSINIHITTDNPQRVYAAVRDVFHKAGLKVPAAGGAR